MSAAESAIPKATAIGVDAVDLTVEGLQWMLLRAAVERISFDGDEELLTATARGAACDVWLNAYDAAPEAVRQSLTYNVTGSAAADAWTPAIHEGLTAADTDVTDLDLETPLKAWVMATDGRMSDDTFARLCRVVQRCGLLSASADRRVMADALQLGALMSPRAFTLLIADPNADAALSGPTRCSAGDAHNPPRHHSVRSADEPVTVHDVCAAAAAEIYESDRAWRPFTDGRLPFAARAMAEEWAYELTGPCGCAGDQRISESTNPLHHAIGYGNDEAGEWLAVRLPPKRLNERDGNGNTPLIAALRTAKPMTRTIAALLSRVPDVDLTPRAKWDDGKERCAAEWIAYRPPQWLSSHLVAEVNLKTQQFGAQYLPSAAVLCAEALCGAVGLPRELVRLVLQYTALPQPNPWPNAASPAQRAAAVVATACAAAAV